MAEVFAEPFARGVRKAITQALLGSYETVFKLVRENLTGRVFQRRTGSSLANVEANSRKTRDGWTIGTTKPGLIAFEKGSRRRAYFVAPVKTKALHWVDPVGGDRFSKGHLIPAWTFPRRSWLVDALDRGRPGILRALETALGARLRESFRGGRLTVRIAELNRSVGRRAARVGG